MLADGTKAKNGFEALAQYDLNDDGVIDENDAIFDKLMVWVDANGDGVSDKGELKTLKELGVKLTWHSKIVLLCELNFITARRLWNYA